MNLEDVRREIDEIDKQLVLFLNQRARLAAELVVTKSATGSPIYDSQREACVLNHVCSINVGPFADDAVRNIFRRIMIETRRVEAEHADPRANTLSTDS